MSIYDNVAFGIQLDESCRARNWRSGRMGAARAALWNEVKDKLTSPAPALSGGQQQRLCIARAIAVSPRCC